MEEQQYKEAAENLNEEWKDSLSPDAIKKFKYEICPDSGFLKAVGICARSGIQEYLGYEIGLDGENANKVFNVYRPKDEVIASLSTYNGAIVTDDHPLSGLVGIDDAQELTRGNTSEAYGVEQDGEYYVIAKTTITSPDLIEKAQEGKRELSTGYTRDLVQESGEYNGVHYDYVQRNIKVNHIAVVQEGRCGNACKLNLDKGIEKMIKIQLDGKSVQMEETEVSSYIKELKAQMDEAIEETAEAKKEVEQKDATLEDLNAQLTEKMSELEDLKKQIEGMLTPEQAEEMAGESTEIENDAQELGVETKEKSNDAKRREILGAISNGKTNFDSISGDALKAVYRISVDAVKKAKSTQLEGYNGVANDKQPMPRTGNFSNDLNAIAREARKNRGVK